MIITNIIDCKNLFTAQYFHDITVAITTMYSNKEITAATFSEANHNLCLKPSRVKPSALLEITNGHARFNLPIITIFKKRSEFSFRGITSRRWKFVES